MSRWTWTDTLPAAAAVLVTLALVASRRAQAVTACPWGARLVAFVAAAITRSAKGWT